MPIVSTSAETITNNISNKRIGILIVAYNAVTTLTKVLKRIPDKVWDAVEEVAVFDDASNDDTYELGLGYKTSTGLNKLTIIKNVKNLGYGGNQKRGYQYFVEKGFDIVILLHGDGQYAPEILENMYMPLVRGEADAVFGSRMMSDYGGPLKGGMPLYKLVGNKILTFLENRMLGMQLTEFHSGYRAYSLHALKQIDFSYMTDDFHFDTEIIIKLHHQGFQIKEVPIPTYYGNEICYVNGLKYAKDVVRSVIRYKRTMTGHERAPEFAEYFVHYPLKDSKYSSHYYFELLTGCDHDVLDIGCGEGFFAERLVANRNRVVGIDLLPQVKSLKYLKKYIQADLEDGLTQAYVALEGQKFDKVLLQDVLEHVRKPEVLVQDCINLLKPNGQLLVSVPNVANITVRLALLLGQFNYTERGILDKTHLRFFTRHTARQLLENNGFEIQESLVTIIPIELVLGLSARNPFMRLASNILNIITRFMPGLFAYQCIFVAQRKRGTQA